MTSIQSKPDDDKLSADTILKLRQYRLQFSSKPSYQVIANIAGELGISKDVVDKFFHEYKTAEFGIDNILDELLEYPSKEVKDKVYDVHLSDVDESIFPPSRSANSQDELMLALSEVGLSTGQMTKFCSDSDIFQVPENELTDSIMSTNQSTVMNKHSQIVYSKTNVPEEGLNQSDFESDSRFYNASGPINFSKQHPAVTPSGSSGTSMFMAPYRINSYSPTQVMFSNSSQSNMFALSSVHCTGMSGKGSVLENVQYLSPNTLDGFSDNFTEYELIKEESKNPKPPLFHRYVEQKTHSKMILPRPTTKDGSSSKSDTIVLTSSDDEGWTNPWSSEIKRTRSHIEELGELPIRTTATLSKGPGKSVRVVKKSGPVSLGQGQALRKRNTRCRSCGPCLAPDCGECMYCLDKPKFGGPNRRKNACVHRRCSNMVPVGRRKSSKSSLLMEKDAGSSGALETVTNALSGIPFEVEGYVSGKKHPFLGSPDPVETSCLPDNNFSSTPVKRRVSYNDELDEKRLKVETDDIDEFVNRDMDNGNLENAHINTAVNVENHLFSQYLDAMAKDESYKYQKFDETVKKVRRNFYESEQGKFLLKEKVVAVELDHSYAGGNSQCFDGGNVDVGELVSSNEMEKASDESIDIGDFYDESSKENGDDEVCDDGNLVLGDCMNKISCVEEEENEVFDDGIVKLEIAEEPINVVACDYSTGDVDDAEAEDGEQKEVVRGDEPLINISQAVVDDTEDKSLNEYYAELDSSDKKEIEKQLTEDLTL